MAASTAVAINRSRWLGRCHGPDSRRAARVVSILAGTEKAVAFEWVADLLDLELVGRTGADPSRTLIASSSSVRTNSI